MYSQSEILNILENHTYIIVIYLCFLLIEFSYPLLQCYELFVILILNLFKSSYSNMYKI